MKRIATILLTLSWAGALNAVGADAPKANIYNRIPRKVPPPEMPAKAAQSAERATAPDLSTITVNVVKAAVAQNPASAAAVVSAISEQVPEMAQVAAGAAAELQPNQAVAIAKAAATAAPGSAAGIAVAVSRAVPAALRVVALAVTETVPGSNRSVLTALAAAFPELRPGIDKALADNTGDAPPVAFILDQATAAGVASAFERSGARGPAIGPPYVAPPLNPTYIYPYSSVPDTHGHVPVWP